MKAGSSRACIDFSNLVVDDNIALEGDEAFTIVINSSMAMVTIIDDDGMSVILCLLCNNSNLTPI